VFKGDVISRAKLTLYIGISVVVLTAVILVGLKRQAAAPVSQSYSIDSPQGQAIHRQMMMMQQMQSSLASNPAFKKQK
jgi:hypothetical protein